MASEAEQLAAGLSWSTFSKAEELKKRIWFTLGALLVFRIGAYIPVPGIDTAAMSRVFAQQQGGLLGIFNIFSGGAVQRMAVFSLSIMPYISASIIIQLLSAVFPHMVDLKKEGAQGRRKLNQYTRYTTVALALFQGYGVAMSLESAGGLVLHPGWVFLVTATITLLGGTLFLMWLGEQITSRGIGNGTSLIIFAGIVAQIPIAFSSVMELGREGAISSFLLISLFVGVIVIITVVVFFERAQRRVVIQYPKRQVSNRMYGGEKSHLPIKLNTAGVIPPIFASSLLLVPVTLAKILSTRGGAHPWMDAVTAFLGRGHLVYMLLYAAGIIFFSFFYTAIIFEPKDVAENLKKNGGFIPGVRPGQLTANYLDYVLTRLTAIGAIYLAVICLIPEFMISRYSLPFAFGGTSVLIVVSVMMDTISQVQGHLLSHQYEGLVRRSRLRRGKK